jgi:hypothetical protein
MGLQRDGGGKNCRIPLFVAEKVEEHFRVEVAEVEFRVVALEQTLERRAHQQVVGSVQIAEPFVAVRETPRQVWKLLLNSIFYLLIVIYAPWTKVEKSISACWHLGSKFMRLKVKGIELMRCSGSIFMLAP